MTLLQAALISTAALLLNACQSGAPDRCRMAWATDIPLTFHNGNLYATPLLNGKPTNMALDTGAYTTILTVAAAHRLSLRLQRLNRYTEGIGGMRQVSGFQAKRFQIGRLQGSNFQLEASDMMLSSTGNVVDGLLGDDFLTAYDLDLDLPQHKAILFRPLSGCSVPSAALGGTLYMIPLVRSGNDRTPHIRVQIAGRTMTAVVDSGSAETVLFRDAARRVGLNTEELTADRHFHVRGIGPRTPAAIRHVMTPITVGELTVQNLPVAIVDQHSFPDVDMLIGLDFLTRVHSWFSFSSRTLILQYPPLASPAINQ